MKEAKRSESGQALILIVLGLVALLGFTALAIDGGRIYSDRRNMQNASDTASLTAAASYASYFDANGVLHQNWDCNGAWFNQATAIAKSAAINRAASNGYSVDDDAVIDDNGVEATCFEVSYGGFVDRYIDIDTFITAETPSSFAQFVFGGPLVQTVRSTARIRPQTSLVFGNAIVAMNTAECQGNQNGAQFDGTQNVHVNGGGVLSMGCLGTNGSGEVVVTNGAISYGNQWSDVGTGYEAPDPIMNSGEIPEQATEIPPPKCDTTDRGSSRSGGSLLPGNYTDIIVNAGKAANLAPGLYCVTGDVRVSGTGQLFGDGVTIFLIGGDFDTSGGATVNIAAPISGPNANILIYMAEENDGQVNLLGNTDSRYTGLVYAPSGTIEVGGASSTLPTFNTQLIGWDVFVHGDAVIDINFEESTVYQTPPNLDLQR